MSNCNTFPYGMVAFRYCQGAATSAEAAREGTLDRQATAEGLYIFDKDRARFERLFTEKDLRKNAKAVGNDVMASLFSFRMVTNGENTLSETVTGLTATHRLTPGAVEFDKSFQFPLPLGRPNAAGWDNIGKNFLEMIQQKSTCKLSRVEDDAKLEGVSVLKLLMKCGSGTAEYWVDLESGSIPRKILLRVDPESPSISETFYFLDDLRLVPGHGWLPFKETQWNRQTGFATQIKIVEADFDKPPTPSKFVFEFPKPTRVIDEARGLRYPPQTKWDLSKLPSRASRGVQRVEQATITRDSIPLMPGEAETRHPYRWLILSLLVSLLAIGLLVWNRRR
jgi:hypothetical protein